MEEALSPENWHAAWKAVVANDGAPGVDGMKCEELVPMLKQHGEKIRAKLLAGTYVPNAVKRVIIPKPGGGERHLSIPTVLDRFVQQLLLGVLSPIWEARFSKSSYGFRLGRSQHDAVLAAQKHIQEGKKDRVRELWDARQSKTNKQMRDQWNQWLKGWIGYYRLGERKAVAYLESWIRRRIRCYYWQRWHNAKGRYAKLRKLGVKAEQAKAGRSSKGAWRMAKHPAMHTALSNAAIRKARILMPSELRARQNSPDATAGCGPACPVVWEP